MAEAGGKKSAPLQGPRSNQSESSVFASLTQQAVCAAWDAEPGALRERADVADLVRQVRQQGSGLVTGRGGIPASPPLEPANTQPLRSRSWCDAEHRRGAEPEIGEYCRSLCVPGGFRRDHLHARAEASGVSAEQRPATWSVSLVESMLSSVDVYERFYGQPPPEEDLHAICATRNLGNLGIAMTVFKGTLGSGIMVMPHAWAQSGYGFGFAAFVVMPSMTILCVLRLLRCRDGHRSSYGDLMETATGWQGRAAVNVCVVLFQSGTCCLFLINVANVIRELVLPHWSIVSVILCEAVMIAPLVLIRNVAKLGPVNLAASMLTVFAIAATLLIIARQVATDGVADVRALRPSGMLVGLGISCFSLEGIGLVIPIYDSARYPRSFPLVYSVTIAVIALLICALGCLGYFAFGPDTKTLLLLDLPRGALTTAIEMAFNVQMLASFPLQLLPALRILEGLFLAPSRPGTGDKHVKSGFRLAYVALVAGLSVLGATSLDHFVSLIGAACGVPLAFVFPALCHLRLRALPWSMACLVDFGLILFGTACTIVISVHSIATWGS